MLGRALRTSFIPFISPAQSAAGAVVGVVDVGFFVVGVVGSVEVGLMPLVLVVIVLGLLAPCGIVWATAMAATIKVRAITSPKAPAITFIALTPFGLAF